MIHAAGLLLLIPTTYVVIDTAGLLLLIPTTYVVIDIVIYLGRFVTPNEIISVFRVTGLKILGRVGTHKKIARKNDFMHFGRHFIFGNV